MASSVEGHNDVLLGELDGSQPSDQEVDDEEDHEDFCSISEKNHVTLDKELTLCAEGRVIPSSSKFSDVVKRTNTTLDVLLESPIDDYWNVHGDCELSGLWSSFTQFNIGRDSSRW